MDRRHRALALPPHPTLSGHLLPVKWGEGKGVSYIPFIASHDTFGFMSAKAPVGFGFQAQTCSS